MTNTDIFTVVNGYINGDGDLIESDSSEFIDLIDSKFLENYSQLNEYNKKRQDIEKNIYNEAVKQIENVMKNIEDKDKLRSLEVSLNLRDMGENISLIGCNGQKKWQR